MAFSVAVKSVSRPAAVARSAKSCQVVCMAVGPRHKGAKDAVRHRPIKYNRSDKNHGPAKHPELPPPPPEFVVLSKPEK